MGLITKRVCAVVVAIVVLTLGLPLGHAADEPPNIIKYRQNVMKAQGGHISNIAAVVKGEVSLIGNVAANARALADLSRMVLPLFPDGTNTGKTNALPEIWTDRAKFDQAAKASQDAADAMIVAAETNDLDTIAAALDKLGKSCGGCHKPFRKKKE
ncbi:MAG: cytochrome c [Alphaproteobacteria bacterium]|jgi:cytochrome c556|nr:cytochrome c [Alphaproteobacteria bacterium]